MQCDQALDDLQVSSSAALYGPTSARAAHSWYAAQKSRVQKCFPYLVRQPQPLRVGLIRLGFDTRRQLRRLELAKHEREDDGDGGRLAARAEGYGCDDVPWLREDALRRRERRRREGRLERAQEGLCGDIGHVCVCLRCRWARASYLRRSGRRAPPSPWCSEIYIAIQGGRLAIGRFAGHDWTAGVMCQ